MIFKLPTGLLILFAIRGVFNDLIALALELNFP